MKKTRRYELEDLARCQVLKTSGKTIKEIVLNIVKNNKIKIISNSDIKNDELANRLQALNINGFYIPQVNIMYVKDKDDISIIAHELGHHFLHPNDNIVYLNNLKDGKQDDVCVLINDILKHKKIKKTLKTDDVKKDTKEQKDETEYYTLFLTMPVGTFEKKYLEFDGDLDKIAKHFQVSEKHVQDRLKYQAESFNRLIQ